jgi:hypothetical protein
MATSSMPMVMPEVVESAKPAVLRPSSSRGGLLHAEQLEALDHEVAQGAVLVGGVVADHRGRDLGAVLGERLLDQPREEAAARTGLDHPSVDT